MCECSKCKKEFEETELTWVQKAGKLYLFCKNCYEQTFK